MAESLSHISEAVCRSVRCPSCRTVTEFSFSVRGTIVRTMEPLDPFLLIVVAQITLMIMISGGWKVYSLAAISALLFAIVDVVFLNGAWRAAAFFRKRIKLVDRRVTLVNFTVKLNCPSCRTDFQVKVLLPVPIQESGEKQMFDVAQAVPVKV